MKLVKVKSKSTIINICNTYTMNQFWLGNEYNVEDTYIVYLGNLPVGIISLQVDKYKNNQKYCNIDMIEIISEYRNSKIGSQIILFIFNSMNIQTIYGEALPQAIPFWYKIGGDFEMSDKKLKEYYNNGCSACFKLTRGRFNSKFCG